MMDAKKVGVSEVPCERWRLDSRSSYRTMGQWRSAAGQCAEHEVGEDPSSRDAGGGNNFCLYVVPQYSIPNSSCE